MGLEIQHHHFCIKTCLHKYLLFTASTDDDFNMRSDCFVCAILTHGEEGVVYGIDDKIEVKQLLEPFKGNNCKGLVGKPKIFFIQVRLKDPILWNRRLRSAMYDLKVMTLNKRVRSV